MLRECMLTTIDNPYDPFDEWDQWLQYDMIHGYNCCGLVDRLTKTSDQSTLRENYELYEEAIDAFIANDFQELYKKVVREVPDSVEKQGLSDEDIKTLNDESLENEEIVPNNSEIFN